MKYILFIIVFPIFGVMSCPPGEYERISSYGPRGPRLLCHPIPQGSYICGQFAEATFGGYINIDQLCSIGLYFKRTRPILVHPGISVEFGTEIIPIPLNKKPCGQEEILIYSHYRLGQRYIYQTKLCDIASYCKAN